MTARNAAPWWRGAVIYQIYPRSYRDSDGDGVGDLRGITEKLEYIADLGCDGIWISPFFKSPMADFGYDVADYRAVDPVFGDLDDFDALVAKAHGLDLKVMIDQVYSHTSDQHTWFQESRSSRTNDKSNWYVWADGDGPKKPPNNWVSVFSGPAWTWSPERGQFYLHNFLSAQPDLNFHEPAVQGAILDVAKFWLDRGVDGFRLDVINFCTHNRALTDNPAGALRQRFKHGRYESQSHLNNCSQPENLQFIKRLRSLADSYSDICLLGEIFDDDAIARQIEYVKAPDRLNTAYSFHLLDEQRASPELFSSALQPWLHIDGWPSWSLGNHDVARFPTRLFGPAPTAAQTKLALAILLTMRGTSFLYQGDELGLPQANVPADRIVDPHSKRNLDGSGRDGARTPFPWKSNALQAGFSAANDCWLPVDPTHTAYAVDTQARYSESVMTFTKEIIELRKRLPALATGDLAFIDAPKNVLAFMRTGDSERRVSCLFNIGARNQEMDLPPDAELTPCALGGRFSNDRIILPAFSGALLVHA